MDADTCKQDVNNIIQPWMIPKEEDEVTVFQRYDRYHGRRVYLKRPILNTHNRINEVIDDDKTLWKRGDILKFPSCYIYPKIRDWREWFLLPPEIKRVRIEARRKNPYIPVYASNQYAILMTRYRVIKEKGYMTYRDYGTHVMMITGRCPGRLRRYYAKKPFRYIISFPYHNIAENKHKKLYNILNKTGMLEVARDLHLKYRNTPESRTMFIEEFQKRL